VPTVEKKKTEKKMPPSLSLVPYKGNQSAFFLQGQNRFCSLFRAVEQCCCYCYDPVGCTKLSKIGERGSRPKWPGWHDVGAYVEARIWPKRPRVAQVRRRGALRKCAVELAYKPNGCKWKKGRRGYKE